MSHTRAVCSSLFTSKHHQCDVYVHVCQGVELTCQLEDRAAKQDILRFQVQVRDVAVMKELQGAGCCKRANTL